jgi:trans-aconitate methyltransferase
VLGHNWNDLHDSYFQHSDNRSRPSPLKAVIRHASDAERVLCAVCQTARSQTNLFARYSSSTIYGMSRVQDQY